MKCPLTGKVCNNLKQFHLTDIVNKKPETYDLCKECINKMIDGTNLKETFPISAKKHQPKIIPGLVTPGEILQTMMEFFGFVLDPSKSNQKPSKGLDDILDEIENVSCKVCGTTLGQISKYGKLGCPHCYDQLGDFVLSLISHTQAGSTQHVGKIPKNIDESQSSKYDAAEFAMYLNMLKEKLDVSIKEERYEDAGYIHKKLQVLDGLRKNLERSIKDKDEEQANLIKQEIKRFIALDRKKKN